MKESHTSSKPIPALCKCRSVQQCETDQNKIELPRFIPYRVLRDKIIWLDLFVDERNFTFAKKMIEANRLYIFSTATDCIDFLELFSRQLGGLISMQDTYSTIVSGFYATDVKVINQLLKYYCIDQICLIVNEYYYENLPDQFHLKQKVNVIYNENPDMVMHHLCDAYSDFQTFTEYNSKLHGIENDSSNILSNNLLPESVSHKIGCSYRRNIHRNSLFTYPIENAKNNRSTSFREPDKNSSNNDNRSSLARVTSSEMPELQEKQLLENANDTSSPLHLAQNQNTRLSTTTSSFPSSNDSSSCHRRVSHLIESQLSSSLQHPNDMNAIKKLQEINDVSSIFSLQYLAH
ncbi:unnamed protein product [Rotaria sp. Silwood2]|nr:unnamed protein product [Rotaria sp. Silwood2]